MRDNFFLQNTDDDFLKYLIMTIAAVFPMVISMLSLPIFVAVIVYVVSVVFFLYAITVCIIDIYLCDITTTRESK